MANFISLMAEADRQHPSWRQKLAWVASVIEQLGDDDIDRCLADIAIYLRLIGSGTLPCREDGGHHRPSRHAEVSRRIHHALLRLRTAENGWLVRRIYPWLPSFDRAFTRPEPLTRIRDLAHRNDIPSELKREIKHTLQNKLHRCAGPEDLQTSAALLERVTDPAAGLPVSFVEQFEVFHAELEEFFGARSLAIQLGDLVARADVVPRDLVEALLPHLALPREDRSGEQLLAELAIVGDVRRALAQAAAAIDDDVVGLELERSDVRLEEHAFIVISQLCNVLELTEPDKGFGWAWSALELTLRQLALGDVEQHAASMLADEIAVWRGNFGESSPITVLRAEAAVERAERLISRHTGQVLARLADRSREIGAALGVAPDPIAIFSEGELRGSLAFQLSKVVQWLGSRVRRLAGSPPWIAAVAGVRVGRWQHYETLEQAEQDLAAEGDPSSVKDPVIALVDDATGDEALPARLVGLLVGRSLPLLSHLAVRARQAGVLMATAAWSGALDELIQGLRRSGCAHARLEVGDAETRLDGVVEGVLEHASGVESVPPTSGVEVVQLELASSIGPVPLEQITVASAGPKADGLRRLALLAQRSSGQERFSALPGLVLPFGACELLLARDASLERAHRELRGAISSSGVEASRSAWDRLRQLMAQLPIPRELTDPVHRAFGEVPLIVRSSASCEDQATMASAGLFTSVANVTLDRLGDAVREVWASLWSPRAMAAVESEIDGDPRMAVVIQPLLDAELSWIMHTVDPVAREPGTLIVELASGLGEVLASAGEPGRPFRLVCDRERGSGELRGFASFERAFRPASTGGLSRELVDYRNLTFAHDERTRASLAAALVAVGLTVEREMGAPQDVEGAVIGSDLYVLQSRPQQGLAPAASSTGPSTSRGGVR